MLTARRLGRPALGPRGRRQRAGRCALTAAAGRGGWRGSAPPVPAPASEAAAAAATARDGLHGEAASRQGAAGRHGAADSGRRGEPESAVAHGARPGREAGAEGGGRAKAGRRSGPGAGTRAGQVCEPAASLLLSRGRGGVPAHPCPLEWLRGALGAPSTHKRVHFCHMQSFMGFKATLAFFCPYFFFFFF